MKSNRLLKKVSKYDTVTFDIFDTLLKRDVFQPKDVFYLVELLLRRDYGIDFDFEEQRIAAEQKARENSEYAEVTLEEIYDEFSCDDSTRSLLESLELEIEASVLHCNHSIKPVYDKCVQEKKTIHIVSDMYLPRTFLEGLLKREGFESYSSLFLSCEYRATKRSGRLFEVLVTKTGIDKKKTLHIGDSLYADFIGPRRVGIASVHIPRYEKNTIYTDSAMKLEDRQDRIVTSLINNNVLSMKNRAARVGYEILGPLLLAYCRWIHGAYNETQSHVHNASLWFCARDMYLFYEVYKRMYGSSSDVQYAYISRKSLRPILTSTTEVWESGSVFPRGKLKLSKIVEYMGYEPADLDIADGSVLDNEYDVRSLNQYPEAVEVLSSKSIVEADEEKCELGLKYLKQLGYLSKSIVLADVGWHATTQYILMRIANALHSRENVSGLYIGSLDGTEEKVGKNSIANYLFDEHSDSVFAKGIVLFETLILAPHGSTLDYKLSDDEIVPVFAEPDNVTDYLKDFQSGAMSFVDDYSKSALSDLLRISSSMAQEAFCALLTKPQKQELQAIGDLDYENYRVSKVAKPDSIWKYVTNPKKLYSDLKYAPWRIGFLYRLLKVRLPYATIYSAIRKAQGKLV